MRSNRKEGLLIHSDGYMSPEILAQNGGETPNCDGGGTNSRRKLFKPGPLTDRTNALILEEVKVNSSMADFSSRMDSIETRLQSVEQKQIQPLTLVVEIPLLKESSFQS